jgi:hypothetical protein
MVIMSKAKSATNATAAKAAINSLPDVIELDEAERISLSVLASNIQNLQGQIANALQSQGKIIAKIEATQGLESGAIGKNYQFNGENLIRPKV